MFIVNFERTHVTVLLVALLVVLAGCSGGGGGADGEATETSADGEGAATDAGSGDGGGADDDGGSDGDSADSDGADAGSGGGSGDDSDSASSGGEDGASGGLSAPLASVAAAESYTATFTLASETVEGTITLDGQIQLAADGTQYTDWTIALSSGQQIVAQQYIPAGENTVYSRTQFGEDDPFVSSSPVQEGTIPNGLGDPYELAGTDSTSAADLQWRYDGVVATPDGQRGKYVIDEVDQLAGATAGFDSTLEFRDVEYIVYVDPGTERVTRLVYTAVVFDTQNEVEQDLSLDYTYTDVGSTTIDRPAWVDQA
jgi:hypothetical protein